MSNGFRTLLRRPTSGDSSLQILFCAWNFLPDDQEEIYVYHEGKKRHDYQISTKSWKDKERYLARLWYQFFKKNWGKKTSYNFGSLTIVDIFIFEFIIITKINIKSNMEKNCFIWIFCVHD